MLDKVFLDKIYSVLESILNSLPNEPLDGKLVLDEMKENGQQFTQVYFFAFYFEDLIQHVLSLDEDFEEHKFKYGSCVIDNFCKSLNIPIDIKTHNNSEHECILNDQPAMDKAFENHGVFTAIVLNVEYEKDIDGEVFAHQKELSRNKESRYNNVSGKHRVRYKSALVKSIDFYAFTDASQLKIFKQGRNSNGKPRPFKYKFNARKIEPLIHIEK